VFARASPIGALSISILTTPPVVELQQLTEELSSYDVQPDTATADEPAHAGDARRGAALAGAACAFHRMTRI